MGINRIYQRIVSTSAAHKLISSPKILDYGQLLSVGQVRQTVDVNIERVIRHLLP